MIETQRRLDPLIIGEYEYEYPIVQGGMSVDISGPELFLAVTREGGLSFVGGCGSGFNSDYFQKQHLPFYLADRYALRDKLIDIRKRNPTKKPAAVNIMCAAADYIGLVRTAVENGAKIIASGAGFPFILPELIEDYPDVEPVPIVASRQGVAIICQRWWRRYKRLPRAIVVENPKKAGGHLGLTPKQNMDDEEFMSEIAIPDSLTWLKDYKEKIGMSGFDISVIPAGGIWDKEDMARMLRLGAQAVQMGTRFITTKECDAPIEFKLKYISATPEDIVIIKSPVGIPGRVLKTQFLEEVAKGEIEDYCMANCLGSCERTYCMIQALSRAARGSIEEGIVFAGSKVWRAKEKGIIPVHQLFQELVA